MTQQPPTVALPDLAQLREKALRWEQCIRNGEGVQADGWCRAIMAALINAAPAKPHHSD